MSNANSTSRYTILTISRDGREINLAGKTTHFKYYESILSPNVSAEMTFIDTGGSVRYQKDYDPQERFGTVYNALPITGNGSEEVSFKIDSLLGSLDFSEKPLYVNFSSDPDRQLTRQGVFLSLFSKSAKMNKESCVYEKYSGNIKGSITKLVNKYLKSDINIPDEISNACTFIGNGRNIFDIAMNLGTKTKGNGNPGFFFYETQDGYNFRSIDDLISQRANYRYSITTGGDIENSFKINAVEVVKNQNYLTLLESGAIYSRNIFINPVTLTETEKIFKLDRGGLIETLGGVDKDIPDASNFTKTNIFTLDVGTMEPTVKGDINNNPELIKAQCVMRYNLLFSQILKVKVPCNPNLRAGDCIELDLNILTASDPIQGINDPVMSGKYLIVDLTHNYDSKESDTSMTVVRDTYGRLK